MGMAFAWGRVCCRHTDMKFNPYGDRPIPTLGGHGVDIAIQRADELDARALEHIARVAAATACAALDIACGRGGQAVRMALAGARRVVALDIADYGAQIAALAAAAGVAERVRFQQADMRRLDALRELAGPWNVIVCQRALHYLPYDQAVAVTRTLAARLAAGGKLYLSASGLGSELGENYAGASQPVHRRFAPLAPHMADKHGIRGPVCLYRKDEFAQLITEAGLVVEWLASSAFGNVKAQAARPRTFARERKLIV